MRWKFSRYAIHVCVLLAIDLAAGRLQAAPGRAARALLWQARQYTWIKTIHLKASDRYALTLATGGKVTGSSRYEYWGAGRKYRIVWQNRSHLEDRDMVVADNGRRLYSLDRVTGTLTIQHSRPTSGLVFMMNPVLGPLAALAPPPPRARQERLEPVDEPRTLCA